MRVRFLRRVALQGGPVFHPGETTETGGPGLDPTQTQFLLGRGAIEPVADKAPDDPPVDKMLRREQATRK